MKDKDDPLGLFVKGGQGREADELIADAKTVGICIGMFIGAFVACAVFVWLRL